MATKKRTAAVQLSIEGTRSGAAGAGRVKAGPAPKGRGAAKGAGKPARPGSRAGRPRAAVAGEDGPGPLAQAVQALERTAEGLHFTHESFAESLLRLPRAEDYEPLTEPLRRLAAATPELLAALLDRPRGARAEAPPDALAEAREAVAAARQGLADALDRLPAAEDYAPVARNLRALASVSPSLMAWLAEVPPLEAPLRESVGALRTALLELDRALDLLSDPTGDAPAAAGRGTGMKVVVRG